MTNYKSKFTGQEIDSLLDFVDDNKDDIAMQSDLPKKVSDLNNDSSFIDNTVNNLVNYYLKTDTYTKTEINTLVNNAASGGFVKVNELPTEDINIKAIYLVPYTGSKAKNLYEEYIYIDSDWEMIGTTKLDLSNYVTVTALNTALADYVLTTDLTPLLNAKQDKIQFSTMPTASEDYLNKILQYTGTTDSDFTNGRFYKCVTDGTDYSWEETSSGGSGQGTLDFNELTNRPQKDVTSMSSIVTPVPLPNHSQLGAVGFTPIGTIISVMGTTAPNNYLACNGQVINISEYPELADYFESQFGSNNYFGGDGETTFAVPDLRGEFLRGSGTNSHTNQGDGAEVGQHQDATNHPNGFIADNNVAWFVGTSVTTNFDNPDSLLIDGNGTIVGTENTWPSSRKAFMTSRPTNTSVLYCIAVRNIYVDARFDYSLDEKVVGTWIDNKPIYQKVIYFQSVQFSGTTYNIQDISFLNIDFLVDARGMGLENVNWYNLNQDYLRIIIKGNNLTLVSTTSWDFIKGYIIIKYTKTTDIVDI